MVLVGFKPDLWWPTGFLQCFDTVGLVIWPVKIVPEMTYYVSSGTLNPTHYDKDVFGSNKPSGLWAAVNTWSWKGFSCEYCYWFSVWHIFSWCVIWKIVWWSLMCDVSGRTVNKTTGRCVWWAALCTLLAPCQEQVPSAASLLCLPYCRLRRNTASTLCLYKRLVTLPRCSETKFASL